MSDDIPIIFAQQKMSPPPVALFLSASHSQQMEQFVIANWRVVLAPDFCGCDIPKELVAESFNPNNLEGPPGLLSAEIRYLPDDWHHRVRILTPEIVKINAAFSEDADAVAAVAANLTEQEYTICAAYWSDDNAVGLKTLDRIDALAVLQPTPWASLNLIAFADASQAQDMLRFGRFYAVQEKRIGELLITKAIRGDYIQQLEEALKSEQSGGPISID